MIDVIMRKSGKIGNNIITNRSTVYYSIIFFDRVFISDQILQLVVSELNAQL